MTVNVLTAILLLGMLAPVADAGEPNPAARIETEYLATLYAPLHAPQAASQNLLIFHPREGGTLSGRITGRLLPPGGDWVRIMPDGTMRIDVRLSAELDDGALLYITYGGVLRKPDAESWARFQAGEKIDAPLWHYVITPNFETASKKYGWLNAVQAIGKFVSIQAGKHHTFDSISMRRGNKPGTVDGFVEFALRMFGMTRESLAPRRSHS